jgi:hypothetical protein
MPEINIEFRTKLRTYVEYKELKVSENYFHVLQIFYDSLEFYWIRQKLPQRAAQIEQLQMLPFPELSNCPTNQPLGH